MRSLNGFKRWKALFQMNAIIRTCHWKFVQPYLRWRQFQKVLESRKKNDRAFASKWKTRD